MPRISESVSHARDTDTVPDTSAQATHIAVAARHIESLLERGATVEHRDLITVMDSADPSRAAHWQFKDAYEACECAVVRLLIRHARALHAQAEATGNPGATMLDVIARIEAKLPIQRHRSHAQVLLQQFSTPPTLAWCAAHAAAPAPGTPLLEPSAGTGMLAALATVAAPVELHLNEIALVRLELLRRNFPGLDAITAHDATQLRSWRPDLAFDTILLNPPFSRSHKRARRVRNIDLEHLGAAAQLLRPGGRIVAITSPSILPGDPRWSAKVGPVAEQLTPRFTALVDGRAYSRHGTHFHTAMIVLDRIDPAHVRPWTGFARADSAEALLRHIDTASLERDLARSTPLPSPRDHRKAPVIPRPEKRSRRHAPPSTPADTSPRWDDLAPLELLPVQIDPVVRDAQRAGVRHVPWTESTVRVAGASPHPTALVETTAMASVTPPRTTYRPILPASKIRDGTLSAAQLEAIVLAGQIHQQHFTPEFRVAADFETRRRVGDATAQHAAPAAVAPPGPPVRMRRGFMIGDNTGVGKGREAAGVILDQWARGRRRVLWLSMSEDLINDARRDWTALGGRPSDVFSLRKLAPGAAIDRDEGILFSTYATLRSLRHSARDPEHQPDTDNVVPIAAHVTHGAPTRFDQIVAWLAQGSAAEPRGVYTDPRVQDALRSFDGVVIFDESHAMVNAAPLERDGRPRAPSAQGRAGLRLQNALPDARVLYISATGATTVEGLVYAERLGLWGMGETPFETAAHFISTMIEGGIAAAEIIARDLKTLGCYIARVLSCEGVEIDVLETPITPEQRDIYDQYAKAFQIIHANLDEALKASGIVDQETNEVRNRDAKGRALSAFESTKQRFFSHLLSAMKCPGLIRAIHRDLDHGHSVIVQLVSTGESLLKRRIAQIPREEWDDLRVDLTPRDAVLGYVEHAFPTTLYETIETEEGNTISRPVRGPNGEIVECAEAVDRRNALLVSLASLPAMPGALDQLVHHFGHDAVAEVTGRSRRTIRVDTATGPRLMLKPRSPNANKSEPDAFMNGEKRILFFSYAGGIGRSYHADTSCANHARRIHYLLESGWSALAAIQGLGRSNRTHQVTPPRFRPVSTDIRAEQRFISTIARRLDSLGAITRGQRDSQTGVGDGDNTLFTDRDNLESPYARMGVELLCRRFNLGNVPGWTQDQFEDITGLSLNRTPPTPKLLNRLLALTIADQDSVFSALDECIDSVIESAKAAGTYNVGVEEIRAVSLVEQDTSTLYRHTATGAETRLVKIRRTDRTHVRTHTDALRHLKGVENPNEHLFVNTQSKRAALVLDGPSTVTESGALEPAVHLLRPTRIDRMSATEFRRTRWKMAPPIRWERAWKQETRDIPEFVESTLWLVTGLLLPVWDHLKSATLRVRTLVTDAGMRRIGRVLSPDEVHTTAIQLGARNAPQIPPADVLHEIRQRGATFAMHAPARQTIRMRERQLGGRAMTIIEANEPHALIEPATRTLLIDAGCVEELVNYRPVIRVPDENTVKRILATYRLGAPPKP